MSSGNIHKLSALNIKKICKAGRYSDGNCLYLVIKDTGARQWVLRLVIRGKRHDMGLGSSTLVSLEEARDLVTGGIFKISRNPMYLGMAAVIAGVGIGIGTWVALAILGFFVFWITEYQIKAEERALVNIFGSEFENYRSKVRRWI